VINHRFGVTTQKKCNPTQDEGVKNHTPAGQHTISPFAKKRQPCTAADRLQTDKKADRSGHDSYHQGSLNRSVNIQIHNERL